MTDLTDLTPRQREVAALVAEGFTSKTIACKLGVEVVTVRVHIAAIAFRLGLQSGEHDERVLISRWWMTREMAAD